jgi:RecT family
MGVTAEVPSQNGNGPKLDVERYRNAVKATMKKRDPALKTRVDPTEEEVDRFLMEAVLYGLEPLAGQIYASWEDGVMKAVTTIDGLRSLAERTGRYDGQSDPEWCDRAGNWTDYWAGEEAPLAARVRVHKKGTKVPTTGTANWHDFAPTGTVGADSLWNMGDGKPAHMLSIRAEALALRKAFPAELSGLYTAEELGISVTAIGGDAEADPEHAVATDIPAGPSAPPTGGTAPPPPPPPPPPGPAGEEQGPAVLVDPPTEQPSGAPARPQAKRTLAKSLASGDYERLRGDLTAALFDQMPDRFTDEQSTILAGALADAEAAGITPYELERVCKVALREAEGHVETRARGILEWIGERLHKAEGDPERVVADQGSEVSGESDSESQPAGESSETPSLLDADPGFEERS